MQQFPCPWCGPRADSEFHYAGDAGVTRPARAASDADWAQYLYFRSNAKGPAQELWVHTAGCGRWFKLDRNTVTHEVIAAGPMVP
jgi:heterotetrameric sarcosine oxidase delta subunit